MFLSGFADEAGRDIRDQIRATKELGWNCIEIRNVGDLNFTDVSDETFEETARLLSEAGVTVPCFGSAVANSGKNPKNPDDVQYSIDALKRALPRMKRLGATMIRGMAFKGKEILKDGVVDPDVEKFVVEKMKELVKMCENAGVIYVCENCSDYSALSPQYAQKLFREVNSPALKLAFDMGNTVNADNVAGKPPYAKQSAWEFYEGVKDLIGHVHIKDAVIGEGGKAHTFPGEGAADVKRIVRDLVKSGYDGGFSIEPHMKNGYDGYVEYGRRFMRILEDAKK
jgi:sugar phosphate isomerase/epimerase